jgi:hypothetical protein
MQHRAVLGMLLVAVSITTQAFSGTHQRGSYVIDNNAYSDETVQVGGPAWSQNSPGWMDPFGPHCGLIPLERILVEGAPQSPREIYGFANLRADIVIEVRFLNNAVVNLAGPDIVFFQLDEICPGAQVRTPGGYMIAVPDGKGGFGEFRNYGKELAVFNSVFAYLGCGTAFCLGGWDIATIEIELSDFGVAEGERISSLRFSTPDEADPVAIAALHSVPLPVQSATWGKVKSLYR